MSKNLARQSHFEYFAKKVPFGNNKELVEKALDELGYKNKPLEEIDLKQLTKKIIELSNRPISAALEQQQQDYRHGMVY